MADAQLRPAITPTSTFSTVPVIQLASSDSRKVIAAAMSSGVPTRPIGWKPLKPRTTACT